MKKTIEQKEENNNVLRFYQECTEEDQTDSLFLSEMYPVYVDWVGRSNALGKTNFVKALEKLGNIANYKRKVHGKDGRGPQGGIPKRKLKDGCSD